MSIDPKFKELAQFDQTPDGLKRGVSQLEDNVRAALANIAQTAQPLTNPTNTKTAAYTAKLDELVVCKGTFPVTIPIAAAQNRGRFCAVLVVSGTITVATASAASLVQGAASDPLSTAGLYLYESTGTGWWRPPTTAGAGVASVTAGAGLVNSGTATNPVIDAVATDASLTIIADSMKVNVSALAGAGLVSGLTSATTLDVVAANGTIIVSTDAIRVGTITSANVDSSIVTQADLATMLDELQEIRVLLIQMLRVETGGDLLTGVAGL